MGSGIPIEAVGCNEEGVTAVQCQPAYLDPSEGSASDTAGQSASVVNVVSSYLYNFMKKTIILLINIPKIVMAIFMMISIHR